MKIVQSFWSKPFFEKKEDNWEGRKMGGWNNPVYYYMSWALSCLLLDKYYKKVELVTDSRGKFLTDLLQLPYSNVVCLLDDLNHYSEELWVLGKVYAYSIQNKPFMHFDNDVFVWSRFSKEINSAELITQSIETNLRWDVQVLKEIFEHFQYLPESIAENPPDKDVVSCNAGVFGGSNLRFIHEFTSAAFTLLPGGDFAVVNHLFSL